MNKSDLKLFQQAISDGFSSRVDRIADAYNDEVKCSPRHSVAMRTIIYGKIGEKRRLTPRAKWIIAILVSAAIILTSCALAIVYHEKVQEFWESISDSYVSLTYSDKSDKPEAIETEYAMTYIPSGYTCTDTLTTPQNIKHVYENSEGKKLIIGQMVSATTVVIDGDDRYKTTLTLNGTEIYYSTSKGWHYYLWYMSDYIFDLTSELELTNEDVARIINGIHEK